MNTEITACESAIQNKPAAQHNRVQRLREGVQIKCASIYEQRARRQQALVAAKSQRASLDFGAACVAVDAQEIHETGRRLDDSGASGERGRDGPLLQIKRRCNQ